MEVLTQFSEESSEEADAMETTNCVTPQRPRINPYLRTGDGEDGEDDGEHVFQVDVDGSPSKRRKPDRVDAVSNNFDVHLFCEALKGGIEVIYCERFNGDSASQLTRIRTMLGEEDPRLINIGIRAVVETGQKLDSGECVPLKNIETYEGRTYNKLALLRIVERTSKKSRKEVLVKLANIMNQETQRLIREKELKSNQPQWRVRKTFDRTPADPNNFRKLDEIVTPVFAVKIVTEAYTRVGPSWGLENAELASLFFSPPYAKLTRDALFGKEEG